MDIIRNPTPKVGGVLSMFGEIFIVRDISMKIKAKGAQPVPLTSLLLLFISIGSIIIHSLSHSCPLGWCHRLVKVFTGTFLFNLPQEQLKVAPSRALLVPLGCSGLHCIMHCFQFYVSSQLNYTMKICFVCFIFHQIFF